MISKTLSIQHQQQTNYQLELSKNILLVLNDNEECSLRSSIHNILLSLGDLQRYITFLHENFQTPLETSQHHQQHQQPNRYHILAYYNQALKIAPFDGSTYRPLAMISRSEGNIFQTAYYLSLSLMTKIPLSTARDLLVEIFETSRQETEHFPVVTALSRMSNQEHLTHFKSHLLAAVGIGYSRTNADLFSL